MLFIKCNANQHKNTNPSIWNVHHDGSAADENESQKFWNSWIFADYIFLSQGHLSDIINK